MRRFIVPLLLFSAIGVVLAVFLMSQGDDDPHDPERDGEPKPVKESSRPDSGEPKTLLEKGGSNTPTKLGRSRWLRELERVMARDDMSHAAYYGAKLCEHMDRVLEDDVVVRNLIALIEKYAIDSRDPRKRQVLLPILRVLTTPEATEIVEREYYRTSDEGERLILLDAMANPGHNPAVAGVWAAEMAVNSQDPENRHTAFLYVRNLRGHDDVVIRTATQIYESTTRLEQRLTAIREIARRAERSEEGRAFLRARLRGGRESELEATLEYIEGWGTMRDASLLEALAPQFPAMQGALRERAEAIRNVQRMKDDSKTERSTREAKERKNE